MHSLRFNLRFPVAIALLAFIGWADFLPAQPVSSNPVEKAISFKKSTVLKTDFSADTIHGLPEAMNASSTDWYVMANRSALSSSVGDNLFTEQIEKRPLRLTSDRLLPPLVIEAVARFSKNPVILSTPGSCVKMTATFRTENLESLLFGLYDSGGTLPYNDLNLGGMAEKKISRAEGGTQNWTGYCGSLTKNLTTAALFVRAAQSGKGNKNQSLLHIHGTRLDTAASPSAFIGLKNDTVYTLIYAVIRDETNSYRTNYQIYEGTPRAADETPLISVSAQTLAKGNTPSAVTLAFDSVALGYRAVDAIQPALTVTALEITQETPSP